MQAPPHGQAEVTVDLLSDSFSSVYSGVQYRYVPESIVSSITPSAGPDRVVRW